MPLIRLSPRWISLAALPLGLALILAAGCGDDDDDTTAAPTATESPAPGELQPQPEPVQELDAEISEPQDGVIEVDAVGILFAPNNLKVALGQAVTIRVPNGDAVPHTLTIAGVDGQYGTEDDAGTGNISADATGQLIFSPQIPGAYTFRCDFHPGRMGGQIVVE